SPSAARVVSMLATLELTTSMRTRWAVSPDVVARSVEKIPIVVLLGALDNVADLAEARIQRTRRRLVAQLCFGQGDHFLVDIDVVAIEPVGGKQLRGLQAVAVVARSTGRHVAAVRHGEALGATG